MMKALYAEEFTPCKVYLTKAQVMSITAFDHTNERYLCISYQKSDDNLDLSRTINLSKSEAAVFAQHVGEFADIINYEEADVIYHWSLLDSNVEYDGGKKEITAYQLHYDGGGRQDTQIYARKMDAQMAREEKEDKENYDIMTVTMMRPERYAVVQNVITEELNGEVAKTNAEDKQEVLASMNKLRIAAIVCECLKVLNHSPPFLAIELVEAFVYCGGLDKITNSAVDDIYDEQQKSLMMAAYHLAMCSVTAY